MPTPSAPIAPTVMDAARAPRRQTLAVLTSRPTATMAPRYFQARRRRRWPVATCLASTARVRQGRTPPCAAQIPRLRQRRGRSARAQETPTRRPQNPRKRCEPPAPGRVGHRRVERGRAVPTTTARPAMAAATSSSLPFHEDVQIRYRLRLRNHTTFAMRSRHDRPRADMGAERKAGGARRGIVNPSLALH